LKSYVQPSLFFVNLRLEERSAICKCTGCCDEATAAAGNAAMGYTPNDPNYLIPFGIGSL